MSDICTNSSFTFKWKRKWNSFIVSPRSTSHPNLFSWFIHSPTKSGGKSSQISYRKLISGLYQIYIGCNEGGACLPPPALLNMSEGNAVTKRIRQFPQTFLKSRIFIKLNKRRCLTFRHVRSLSVSSHKTKVPALLKEGRGERTQRLQIPRGNKVIKQKLGQFSKWR